MPISLGKLAAQFGCELRGDAGTIVDRVSSLQAADSRSLTFLSGNAFKTQLATTKAAAVILRADDATEAPCAVLISDNPHACYARIAAALHPAPTREPGVHASAVIAQTASISKSAHISANAVVGNRSSIGANVYVGPGVVVGPDCSIDDDCQLLANATLVKRVRLGKRGIVHSGAVLGADGFGNAPAPDGWVKVPQLGGVQIGDDVEIGANSTIDCGALEDTIIEDGVRLDNLVQIAHNVKVGEHTAMAAATAIAGSTIIGKRCMFGGQSGSVGHVTICDDVIVTGRGMITKDITEAGTYGSFFPSEKAADWGQKVARFRRLDKLAERVSKLEKGSK